MDPRDHAYNVSNLRNKAFDESDAVAALNLCRGAQDHAVREGWHGQVLHIIGDDVIAAIKGGGGLSRMAQGDSSPGGGPRLKIPMVARRAHPPPPAG